MERNFETNCTQCTQCRNFEKREKVTFIEVLLMFGFYTMMIGTFFALIVVPIPSFLKPFLIIPIVLYFTMLRIIFVYKETKKFDKNAITELIIPIVAIIGIAIIIWTPVQTNLKLYVFGPILTGLLSFIITSIDAKKEEQKN